jgi:hypothetical protein
MYHVLKTKQEIIRYEDSFSLSSAASLEEELFLTRERLLEAGVWRVRVAAHSVGEHYTMFVLDLDSDNDGEASKQASSSQVHV